MKKLFKLVGALVCVLGFRASAQMTTITASSIKMGGTPIAAGSVTLTPVDENGKPIPFVQAGGGLNSGHPFTCRIQNGAITGICQVPDSALTTPAHIEYSIQISSTPSQKAFVLNAVPNIAGSTWALDEYAPAANTTNVEPIQVSYGTAAPTGTCVAPSFYVRNAFGGLLYMCVGNAWVQFSTTGGGSASVTPESMSSAVATLTGCSDATKSWNPAANACVSNTGPQGPKGDTGATGATGSAGAAATISVGTVTTGAAGSNASVTNAGTSSAAILNLSIPRGADGAQGATGPKGDPGDTGPAGTAATVAVGTVATDAAGSNAAVTNSGTSSAAVLNFTIPRGADGATGPKGDRGDTGPKGDPGTAATIAVGTVTPLAPGATPTVTNSGTSSAAVLNFGLPTVGTRNWSCQPGLGDGVNTIATGTYIQWTCRNDTGSTITLTGISCIADAGSSTVSMTNSSDLALLSTAITCGTSYTAGTQSSTTTLADGDFIKLSVAATGSKQVAVDVKGTL